MYVKSYKLNNSYTTYVIHHSNSDDVESNNECSSYCKPLEWKCGVKVKHAFHGTGIISSISENQIVVHFKHSKVGKKNISVSFFFENSPDEIDSLNLCDWQKFLVNINQSVHLVFGLFCSKIEYDASYFTHFYTSNNYSIRFVCHWASLNPTKINWSLTNKGLLTSMPSVARSFSISSSVISGSLFLRSRDLYKSPLVLKNFLRGKPLCACQLVNSSKVGLSNLMSRNSYSVRWFIWGNR